MKYNELLNKLLRNAYSPYFKFDVACIIEMNDGNIFEGVNFETSACSSICAERSALAAAITKGYHKGDFKALYLKGSNNEKLFPCFICRQYLIEFCEEDMPIISIHNNTTTTVTLKDLTPFSFGPENIKE